MKVFTAVVLLACLLSALASQSIASDIPTDLEMRAAAESWLRGNIQLQGRWSDADPIDAPVSIASTQSIMSGDTLLASAYHISSGGVIVVPATKRLPSVLQFSTSGDWSDIDLDYPCNHALTAIRRAVTRALRAAPGIGTDDSWSLMTPNKTTLPFGTIIRVGPLMDGIDWSQCEPLNGACPSAGDSCNHTCPNDRSVLGCVASSLSRLLRYHAYPDSGTGTSLDLWNGDSGCTNSPGDSLSADWSELIDWDLMPESCSGGACNDTIVQAALADLCYRVAVGLHTDFGHNVATAYFDSVPPLLENHLGYRCVSAN